MKKILIFEYITGGGLIEKKLKHNLYPEANIILNSLICNKMYDIDFFCDYRHDYKYYDGAVLITPDNKEDIYNTQLINNYDYFLPICPEIDLIYHNYVKKISSNIFNTILSDTKTMLITSDKLLLKKICNENNIDNPDSFERMTKGKYYIEKDRYGCGCSNINLIRGKKENSNSDRIVENYIPGNVYSVSTYITVEKYKVISINQQKVHKNNNKIILKSLLVNIYPSFTNYIYKFIDDIISSIPELKGFVGFDFIENNGTLFLIEINARFTTSMAAIEKCKDIHPLCYVDGKINDKVGKTCQINL